jgi:hypothetical protein
MGAFEKSRRPFSLASDAYLTLTRAARIHRAVRDDWWKLVAYPSLHYRQLFDLENDPLETRNLVGDAGSEASVDRRQVLMREWQRRSGDTVEVPTDDREPPAIDLSGERRTPDRWQPAWIVEKYFDMPAGPASGLTTIESAMTAVRRALTAPPRRPRHSRLAERRYCTSRACWPASIDGTAPRAS